MTNETNYRGKASAVFFAAVMVISMVAVGFAAAPAAAADTDGDNVNITYNVTTDGQNITEGTEVAPNVTIENTGTNNFNATNIPEGDEIQFQVDTTGNGSFDTTAGSVEFTDTNFDIAAGESADTEFTDAATAVGNLSAGSYDHRVVLYNTTNDEVVSANGTNYSSATETLNVDATDETTDSDVNVNDANLVFQGQVVLADGENVSSDESITLRRGSPDDDNSFVRQSTANNNGEVTFQTDNLESDDYYIENSDGNPVGDFEVTTQSFDGEFDPTEVDNGGESSETTHTVDTNRGGEFNVTVSAESDGDAVDSETLVDIIDGGDGTVTDDVEDDDEAVRVSGVSDGADLTADFDGQDAGEYDITVEVEDTTAEANETITVNDIGDGAVSLENGYVTTAQGDNAELTLEFDGGQDMGYVRVGDESEVGYEANVTVDSGGEENVTLLFNTYAAGNETRGDFVTIQDADDSDAEIVETTEQSPEDLDSILAMGTYPIEISGDSLDAIANDEATDVGDLEIQEREVGEFNVWTTSDNTLEDLENADDVANATNGTLSQQSEIANGDAIVHEIQATGLEGIVESGVQEDADGFLGTLSEEEAEGLDLRIRQTSDTTAPNSQRKTANLTAMADDISVIEGDGVYYLAFDSDDIELENDRDVETGDAYEVRLRIKDERLLNVEEDEWNDGEPSDFYQTATTNFSVEEAEGSFDEPVEVGAAEDQVISGETNVAAGNTLSVRARSNDDVTPGFVVSQSEVEVDSNGTFTAEGLDFSDASVDDNFTVTTRNSPFDEEAEADGMVVESVDNGTDGNATDGDDGNVTDGEDGDDGNMTDGEDGTDDGEDGTDDGEDGTDGTDGETDDGTPGFGALVALVALIAAALLATRRRE